MSFKLRFVSLIFLLACTRNADEKSGLRINLPSSASLQSSSHSTFSFANTMALAPMTAAEENSPFNPFLNPATLSGFDCFAVLVGGGSFNDLGYCTLSDGQSFPIGEAVGGFPSGYSVAVDVPSGNRTLVLVGFNVESSSYCRDFFNQSLPDQKISQPHVLAKQDFNLPPGDTSVTLTASYSSQKVSSCRFANGDGSGGAYYGSGSDGDVNYTTSPIELFIQTGASGRYLTSTSRVIGISDISTAAESDLVEITVQSAWTDTSNVDTGDEVVLYIPAAHGSTGCENGLVAGMWTSSVVTSYQSSGVFRAKVFDSRFMEIASAQLNANGYGANPDFCRVLAIRVPHIDDMTLNYSGTISLRGATSVGKFDLLDADHENEGGVLFMRVAGTISVTGPTWAYFDLSAKGFYGGITTRYRGQGIFGQFDGILGDAPLLPIGNGAGYTAGIAHGGGHGGQGGFTSGGIEYGGNPVGDAYGCGVFDSTKKCLGKKFFLGGGGGFDSGTHGGIGGGAFRIFANNIVNNGILTFNTNGGNANGGDNGGGAGGSVFVDIGNYSGSGNIEFRAVGGDGSGVGAGGVGGGGRIHVKANSDTGTGSKTALQGAGTVGILPGATDGTCYAQGITVSGCP